LRLLAPITPHLAHYLWINLGLGENILKTSWPVVDKQALATDDMTLVIQVNGKMRGQMTIASNADVETIEQTALTQANVMRHLNNQPPKKIIVIPKKLVNIVV